ncbi:hypothetical protein ScPMuIL_004085 [Solemya velum]
MSGTNGGSEQVILATAGYDHTIRFWHAHSGICYRTVQHPDSQVNALEITPDKQLIAAAGYQHIRMYDLNLANPNPIVNYDGITKNVTSVGFQEAGKWMYTGSEDGDARLWDIRSRNLQCQKILQVQSPINCMCLHPNQGEVFIGDQAGIISVWDLKSDKSQRLEPEPDSSIQSISIDPTGTIMAAVTNKGKCHIWKLRGGLNGDASQAVPRETFAAHQKYALKCLFSPDSTLLATTSADMSVKIWRTADLSLMSELKENTQRWVWDCAFSGDSQYLITASSDNMARLWNVDKGEVKKEYTGHQKAVVCLAFRDEYVS